MTIYNVELGFDVSVNVTGIPLYAELTDTFTHVRKISVPFVTRDGNKNVWADYNDIASYYLDVPVLPNTDNVDSIIESSVFDPEAADDTTFTEFTTGDLVEDMYDSNSWGSAVATARGFVNNSISSTLFPLASYNKFKAGFDITGGVSKSDGFGYLGTRIVDAAASNDPLEGDTPNPRTLAIIFYQSSTLVADVV
jgi:hypothetical protein